ncbi:MAG: acetyl-CoA carboxylase biotin carboxylase subunit [Nitrososphaerales archaeon]
MPEFERVLVANRGEIALRIVRSLKTLGILSIAVYSDVDASSLHVLEADQAFPLQGVYSSETYLSIGKMIEIARKSNASAIHPGYGFLSENPSFSRACKENAIKFIGPSPETLEKSSNKLECKKLAEKNGVPVIPYSKEPVADSDEAVKLSKDIGFPVLIKSAFGGGGRGIKQAENSEQVKEAFESSKREAKGSFGRFAAFIEKKLVKPRHIEIQVLASDDSSELVHLGERECSIQRRYQKLVELSPSPVVDEDTRKKVGEYAIKACRAVKYANAGTVEFLRDADGNFYFLEINSRLQVEHPVTEFVSGVDIVASQIEIASKRKFHWSQRDIELKGAAIECRINAEDPFFDFAPSSGQIESLAFPSGPGVRVDSGLYEGQEITPFYDSLLAKVITHGESFDLARRRMLLALEEFTIAGVESTIPFHKLVMVDRSFISGNIDTSFVEESSVSKELKKRAYGFDFYAMSALLLSKNWFPGVARTNLKPQQRNDRGRYVEPV